MKNLKRVLAILLIVLMAAGTFPTLGVEAAEAKIITDKYTIYKGEGIYPVAFKLKIKAKKGYNVYYTTNDKPSTKRVIKSGKSKSITINKLTILKVYAAKKSKKMTNAKLKKYMNKGKFKKYSYSISDYPAFADAFTGVKKAAINAVVQNRLEYMGDGVRLLTAIPVFSKQFISADGKTTEYFARFEMYGLAIEKGRYVVKNGGKEVVKITLDRDGSDYKVSDIRFNTDGQDSADDLKDMCKGHKNLALELEKSASSEYANLKKVIEDLNTYNKKNQITDITAIKFTDGLAVCIE